MLTALEIAGAVPPAPRWPRSPPPVRESRDTFMPLLVNALAELDGAVVLVLDDVHVLRSRECLNELAFLVLHAPDSCGSCSAPAPTRALPLHVLRVRGRLAEIRAARAGVHRGRDRGSCSPPTG